MGNMFANASRPFYQSVSMMYLECIGLSEYENFARRHFENSGRKIGQGVVADIYDRFDGVTWYVQKMLNMLYGITPERGECRAEMLPEALGNILDSYKYTYQEILFRLPERQKELLIAISKEGAARAVTSGEFVQKYSLPSPSSVQAALKGLLEKDFVTHEQGVYRIYDKFSGYGSIRITDRYADTPAGAAFRKRKIDGLKPSIFRLRRISRFNFRLLRYVSTGTNYPENGRR